MQILQTISGFLSLAIVVILALVALVMACGWSYEKWTERRDRFFQIRVDKMIASRFAQDCYWFSEDQPTYLLLKEYGENLYRVDTLRDHWRENRKKFHVPAWTSVEVISGPGFEFGVISNLDGGRLVLAMRDAGVPKWPNEKKVPPEGSRLVVEEGHEAFVVHAHQNVPLKA